VAANGNDLADLTIHKVPVSLAEMVNKWIEDQAPNLREVFLKSMSVSGDEAYETLVAKIQAFAAEDRSPEDYLFLVLTLIPTMMQVAGWREGYSSKRIAEYAAKKKALIEIPGPGEIIRSMINSGGVLFDGGTETGFAKALRLHGFGAARAYDLEAAARHTLDTSAVWKVGRRIEKPKGFDILAAMRRSGMMPDQVDLLGYALESLPSPDLIARLGWRTEIGPEDLKARMMETGVAKEYADEWLSILESVLPANLVVRGWWREAWNRDGALKRLRAGGLREKDREAYLDLSTTLLPADLIARGLWRGRDDAEAALDRMTAQGVDRKDAAEWLVRMQSLMGAGDLSRLLFAGQIDENGYVKGLEHLGVHTDDALALGKWPWQPIPASETLRLYMADRLGETDARKALRTTGIPPEVADAILAWPWKGTGVGEAKLLFTRGAINSGEAADRLKASGMRPDDAAAISLNLQDPLPIDALFQLHRRGLIDRESMVADLIRHGYAADAADRLAELCWLVPNPADVITFAVRDVFEEDVVEHFGYDEEFPETFADWAKKAGITRDVAKLHWWSHWYVPGIGEVFNMFHRIKPGQHSVPREDRVTWVNDKDVDVYLKTQDYPPWWREPIKAISYHPIARIDLRRAYQDGFADEEDVYDGNRALGYSHEHAEILTNWTKWAYLPEDDALLVARVRDGLIDGSLTPDAARALLAEIELTPYRVDLIIAWAEYEREKKKKDLSSGTVQKLYVEGFISEDDARTRLGALNYGGTEIELLLDRWGIDRQYSSVAGGVTATRPTRTNLAKFWKDGVIAERDWDDEMAGLGYDPRYAAWYKEDDLIAWTDDVIGNHYVVNLMYESTMRAVFTKRGWTKDRIQSLIDYKRGEE